MFRTVELPLWFLVLVLLFAAVTFASHFLFPSVRWFFRRRAERLVAKLNRRLERPIQPFKLAERYDTIQRLLYDPKVIEAVAEHAAQTGVPEGVAFQEARRYAREIVPRFSPFTYFGFATRAAKFISRSLYEVHLDDAQDAALKAIDSDATVVFVMNHRSNMDYVLVTHLVAERSALSYAVGEWARIWPLSALIRAVGGFFIRRRSRNALYRRVLARYVQLATRNGVTQAVFPEGGLSLTGEVGLPKLGLLSYIVAEFDPDGRDVVFVPVAINYDRVLEDRVLTEAAKEGTRRFRASIPTAMRFFFRYVFRRIIGTAVRFGHAGVRFGVPLSLKQFREANAGDIIADVGMELRRRIQAEVPVLPVPAVSRVLEELGRPLTVAELKEGVVPHLDQSNHPAMADPEAVVRDALANLTTRSIVEETPDGIIVRPDGQALVHYYANSIRHLV